MVSFTINDTTIFARQEQCVLSIYKALGIPAVAQSSFKYLPCSIFS